MVPLKNDIEKWDTDYGTKGHRVVIGYINFQLARYGIEHDTETTEYPDERYEENYLKEFGKWVRYKENATEQKWVSFFCF